MSDDMKECSLGDPLGDYAKVKVEHLAEQRWHGLSGGVVGGYGSPLPIDEKLSPRLSDDAKQRIRQQHAEGQFFLRPIMKKFKLDNRELVKDVLAYFQRNLAGSTLAQSQFGLPYQTLEAKVRPGVMATLKGVDAVLAVLVADIKDQFAETFATDETIAVWRRFPELTTLPDGTMRLSVRLHALTPKALEAYSADIEV